MNHKIRILVISTIAFFTSLNTNAQIGNAVYFGLSTEMRIEPLNVPTSNFDAENASVSVDVNNQLSGAALNYFISFYWREFDVEIGFSHALRYDHLYYDTDSLTFGTNNLYSSKNTILSDYQLFIQKHFKLKRNVKWNIYAGYAFMNRGSKYLYTESFIRNPLPFPLPFPIPGTNVLVTEVKEGNFNMDALNFGLGVGANKFSFDIGAYYTLNHNYEISDNIIVPRAKLSYKILNLNE